MLERVESMLTYYKEHGYDRSYTESHIKVIIIEEYGFGSWLREYNNIVALFNKYYEIER